VFIVEFPNSILGWLGTGLLVLTVVSLLGAEFHDIVHLPVSQRRIADHILLLMSAAPVGVSPLWWSYKHVRLHHRFPSSPEFDPDIQFKWIGRVSPQQRFRPLHRWQHLYFWALLPFSTINMLKPGEPFQATRFSRATGISASFSARQVLVDKYFGFIVFWGAIVGATDVRWTAIVFIVFFLTTGLAVSLITQVQHNTMATIELSESVPSDSLLRQVMSSSDVGREHTPWWFLCGGVNIHAAHHLAPTVSHLRTPTLTHELEAVLAKHGLHLPHHGSMLAAVKSHYQLVKYLSSPTPSATKISIESGAS